jgi:IclR family transcriptional regulator, KDG regulon repressor
MPRLTPAVLRTLDILELFLDGGAPLSAPEVVKLTGLPRTTAHELLATLTARGYLQKDEQAGTYRLGVRLLHLGNAYSSRFDILHEANEVARDVSDATGETVSVALLQGAEVFYLAKIESRDILRLPSSIGQRLPANVTGLGKALLAYLPPARVPTLFPDPQNLPVMTENSIRTLDELERELDAVRARGVAFEREESTPNIRCAAAPVRDVRGDVVAAISVSVSAIRWQQFPEQHWVDFVTDAAARLSALLGYESRVEGLPGTA